MRATSLQTLRAAIGSGCAVAALMLVGCASTPHSSTGSEHRAVLADGDHDGADPNPPPGLDRVADAEPRIEPIRRGGPNKPYAALGRDYVPVTEDQPFSQRGLASWYGRKFQGRRTSSGEPYDMYAMTAAHPTLPIPSYARVRNPANGREVIVRINDRGPFHSGRIIDLSYVAARKLDLLRGVAPVEVERITFDEIRAGIGRRAAPGGTVQVASVDLRAQPDSPAAPLAPARAVQSTLPISPASEVGIAAPARSMANAPVSPPTAAGLAARSSSSSVEAVAATGSARRSRPASEAAAASLVEAAAGPVEAAAGPADAAAGPAKAAAAVPVEAAAATTAVAVAITPTFTSLAPPATSAPEAETRSAAADLAALRGFWIQLGAFRERDGALAFQRRVAAEVDGLSAALAVFADTPWFRLQAGPYPNRVVAARVAASVRAALQLVPVIVERR